MDEERIRRDMIRRDHTDKIRVMEYANWLYEYTAISFADACKKAVACKRYWAWIRTRDDAQRFLKSNRRSARTMQHAIRIVLSVRMGDDVVLHIIPGRSPPRLGVPKSCVEDSGYLVGERAHVGVKWLLKMYREALGSRQRIDRHITLGLMHTFFFFAKDASSPYFQFQEGSNKTLLS